MVGTNPAHLRKGYARAVCALALMDGTHLWVITEGNRQVTTVPLPEEY